MDRARTAAPLSRTGGRRVPAVRLVACGLVAALPSVSALLLAPAAVSAQSAPPQHAPASRAEPSPAVQSAQGPTDPADTLEVRLPVLVAPGGRPGQAYLFAIAPLPGTAIVEPSADHLTGIVEGGGPHWMELVVRTPAPPRPGTHDVATIAIAWQDGTRDSSRVRILVPESAMATAGANGATQASVGAGPDPAAIAAAAAPAADAVLDAAPAAPGVPAAESALPPDDPGGEWLSQPVGGMTKEIEVELYGTSRTAAPGGLVVVRYNIMSFEDTDEHVRLRLTLPDGWTLLDRDVEDRAIFLEAWEEVEGEIRVMVPRDARPGERHAVRLLTLVDGESGGAAVYSRVHVQRRGGLQAGAVGLTGTASVQASGFGMEDFDGGRYGGVLDLSGRLARNTTVALNYRQGPRENTLTNYRIAQEQTRWSGTLRRPSWMLQVGNQVGSPGSALTGPYVRGEGLSLRRTQGRIVGDLALARPTTFSAPPAGHLARGSIGVAGSRGRAAVVLSDFGRPVGGYSTVPIYPEDIHPDSLERLERERLAAEKAPSNRIQGAGLDLELRAAKGHRLTVRGGWLRLHNAAGDTIDDPSVELGYGVSHRRATLNALWRRMPVSLPGVHLPGDETALDASLRLVGELRLTGRTWRNRNETLGNGYRSEGEGTSAGLRWFRQGWRFDVRGTVREWSYGESPTASRTVNLSAGAPVGPLSLSAGADIGEQRRDTLTQPTASYRGSLRWNGRAGSASWSVSYYETLNVAPRLRTDFLGSVRRGEWEVAGGAWATRGYLSGGHPGFWSQVVVPITHTHGLVLGAERAPRTWGQPPEMLGTVGIRQKLALPIPFVHDGSVPR